MIRLTVSDELLTINAKIPNDFKILFMIADLLKLLRLREAIYE